MLFRISCILAFVSLALAVVQMFRVVGNRRPERPLFVRPWLSPFNVLFAPDSLTLAGQRHRWLFFMALVAALVFYIVSVLTGLADSSVHFFH